MGEAGHYGLAARLRSARRSGMIAVDTDVLVRFLVSDEPKQAARTASLIRGDRIWVAKTALLVGPELAPVYCAAHALAWWLSP